MEIYLIAFLFLIEKIMASTEDETGDPNIPFTFVAGIVDADTSNIIATAAVIAPHWVLTSAHLLTEDTRGIDSSKYFIVAGRPFHIYYPSFVITHPTYTWGLYTAEDLALFFVDEHIQTRPVLISGGRFPWNFIECDFIFLKSIKFPNITRQSLVHFGNEITVVQNCLKKMEKVPMGLLQYYLNGILCGKSFSIPDCVGRTGGVLFCENLLVGLLIRHEWCRNKTANFTDIGAYFNWLRSRVHDGLYIRLRISSSSPKTFTATSLFKYSTFFVLHKII